MLTALLAAAIASTCLPDAGIAAICGPVASEDLARIPGTPWLVASGLNVGSPAHLYRVDSRDRRADLLFPRGKPALTMEPAFRGVCPGPIDPQRMSLDGLNIRANERRPTQLLAANHGDRHAIEFFRIDARGVPELSWVGCVLMPPGTLANAVVSLADGGLLATSFHDPDDPQAWARMDRGEATGSVWEWHAASGWRQLPGEGIPGANGLELSTDERTLYVSAWASSQLLVIDRQSGRRRALSLDFHPDNLHRTAGGKLLVGGQRASVRNIGACGASCPQPWVLASLDPRSGVVATLLSGPGSDVINYACGAVEVDGVLFMSLRGAARIAWAPVPPAVH